MNAYSEQTKTISLLRGKTKYHQIYQCITSENLFSLLELHKKSNIEFPVYSLPLSKFRRKFILSL